MSTRSTKTGRRKSERFNQFVVSLRAVRKAAIRVGHVMEDLSESFYRVAHRVSSIFQQLNDKEDDHAV